MPIILNPQEIYLLELYTSVEYFRILRDTWGKMISHLERCLDNFTANLPSDYRNRPRPEQPDVVWGERVIPNFRVTLHNLSNGLIELQNGDFSALKYSHGPMNDFKGQMDYWSGWMSPDDENTYASLLNSAIQLASNIVTTIGANWDPMELTEGYSERDRGVFNIPASWPIYQLLLNSIVKSGEQIIRPGVYVPDIPSSCAEFLYARGGPAPEASARTKVEELFNPVTNEKYGERIIYEKFPCVWTLVERVSNFGGKSSRPTLLPQPVHRVRAGELCPQTGYYLTPARLDARQKFEVGQIMPGFESNYGEVIWQWDTNQD